MFTPPPPFKLACLTVEVSADSFQSIEQLVDESSTKKMVVILPPHYLEKISQFVATQAETKSLDIILHLGSRWR
jgi:hypothetical protein